jgi:membrane protease YdiL (CAAX protease family)
MGVVVALALHFARIDVKWPEATPLFLVVNLFLTVIAEEAFFRGFIQERFTVALSAYRWHKVAAITVSALLFGVAHVVAGLGYAIAYQRTRRIESAIAAHFLLNAVHFLTLSYPYLS